MHPDNTEMFLYLAIGTIRMTYDCVQDHSSETPIMTYISVVYWAISCVFRRAVTIIAVVLIVIMSVLREGCRRYAQTMKHAQT